MAARLVADLKSGLIYVEDLPSDQVTKLRQLLFPYD